MAEPPVKDPAASVLAATRQLRQDQREREAIEAEANDQAPPDRGSWAPPPEGVWEGTLGDLNQTDITKPERIAGLGNVPVIESAKVVLYGAPSSTKTLLALHAALSVAQTGGGVWLLQGEGHPFFFRHRINRIANGMNADPSVGERIRITHRPFLIERDGARYWRSRLDGWRPQLVVLDPLIDYTSAAENDAKEMRAYLRLIQIATDQHGCAAIVCHHSTKPGEKRAASARGSSSIKGWADIQIRVEADPDKRERGLVVATTRCEKGRDLSSAPDDAELRWSFTDDAIGLEVVEPDVDEAEEQERERRSGRTNADRKAQTIAKRRGKLVKLLGRHGALTRREIRARTNWGGAVLNELLDPMFDEGLVHIAQALRRTKDAKSRRVEVLRLGPAPAPDALADETPATPTEEPKP